MIYVYAEGLCYCSVCTDIPDINRITKKLNEDHPTGLGHGWELSKENFKDGSLNPHPCEHQSDRHKHYLFVC